MIKRKKTKVIKKNKKVIHRLLSMEVKINRKIIRTGKVRLF